MSSTIDKKMIEIITRFIFSPTEQLLSEIIHLHSYCASINLDLSKAFNKIFLPFCFWKLFRKQFGE